MPVAIKGTGGGSVTLTSGAAATDTTLTLPNTTGTILQSGTAVTVAQGGTGAATLTANAVLIGNGTSAVTAVAPGTSGNVLTSNGTTWASTAPAAGSLTLLATLTTTSGTTQSATGLATTYTSLLIVVNQVTNSTAADALQVAISANNGSSYGSAIGLSSIQTPVNAICNIYMASQSITTGRTVGRIAPTSSSSTATTLSTPTSGPINAIQFSWVPGYTFNAGTIYIYGWN